MKITVDLTLDQCATLAKVLDNVPGMENARVLLPIYDAIKQAVAAQSAEQSQQWTQDHHGEASSEQRPPE